MGTEMILTLVLMGTGFVVGWATGLLLYFEKTGKVILNQQRSRVKKEPKVTATPAGETEVSDQLAELREKRTDTLKRLAQNFPDLSVEQREEAALAMEREFVRMRAGS